jgi:pimeloyl-ACP methyl ester carboxylesterase
MPFFDNNDIAFHYLDTGAGTPFVFQHGMGGDSHQIQDAFGDPAPYRLLTLDCRGHGKTTPLGPISGLSFNQYSDDLLGLLNHLALDNVLLGGISMGAGVALNFALRYPERVTALVLVRPAWLDEPLPPNLQVYPRIAALIRHYGPLRATEMFQQSDEYLAIHQAYPVGAASLVKQFTRLKAQEYVAILERLPVDVPVPTLADLSRIIVPTLILVNENDPVHPHHYGEVLHKAIYGSFLETITSKENDARQHAVDMEDAIQRFFQTWA